MSDDDAAQKHTDEEIQSSTPGSSGPARASGDMGVSSERVGHAGPGQEATDGTRYVSADGADRTEAEDARPEQSTGNPEFNPTGLPPKAGYSERDPRDDDEV